MLPEVRIGHVADIHFSEKQALGGELVLDDKGINVRLGDVERCFDHFTAAARAARVEVNVIAGDEFDRAKPTPNEERAAIGCIDRLAAVAPVIMIAGNHDYNGTPGEASAITCLRGRPGIHVAEQPGCFDFAGDHLSWYPLGSAPQSAGGDVRARFFVLPWPSRAALLADDANSGLTPDELTGLVSKRLQLLAETMRGERLTGVPNILVFHGTIAGCEVNEQPASLQSEIGLRPGDLFGFELVLLGHIHKHQFIDVGGGTIACYPGSIERQGFGEEHEAKGGMLYSFARDISGAWSAQPRFVETPARPYRTHKVEDVLAGQAIADDGRTVHRVTGKVQPEVVGELRARMAGLGVRHLVPDFDVIREARVQDAAIATLSEEAIIRRRLEERGVAPEKIPAYLSLHFRIAASTGGAMDMLRAAAALPSPAAPVRTLSAEERTADLPFSMEATR